jgi:hypothetical protein
LHPRFRGDEPSAAVGIYTALGEEIFHFEPQVRDGVIDRL